MVQKTKRQEVIDMLKRKVIKQSEAAVALGISVRQIKRLCRIERQQSNLCLIPKRKNQPAINRVPCDLKQQIILLAKTKYLDFGPTFMCEKLKELDNIIVSKESIRKILIDVGLWQTKKIKKKSIYQRRERRACLGELVQIDGSPHAWFEDRGQICCLILFIDDATSLVLYAQLEPVETTAAYFRGIYSHVKTYGIPLAYYSDKHMIFRVSNAKVTEANLSQFERACKELGIEGICANSPQAKGRVERKNRVFQDRLVKEFRLASISTIEAGNKFLESYIPKHNKQFGVCARNPEDAHMSAIPDDKTLAHILSIQSERKISKNLEISFENIIYQIITDGKGYRLQNNTLTVCKMLNGDINLLSSTGELLNHKTFNVRNHKATLDDKSVNSYIDKTIKHNQGRKPGADHPWKQSAIINSTYR